MMDKTAKVRYATAALSMVLAGGTGCTPLPPRDTHDADVRSISEGEVSWLRQWGTLDVERIVATYAEDATVMAPNMVPAVGREAIREMVKQIVRDGNFAFTFEKTRVEVARSGDYGYVQGSYTMTMTDLATKKALTDQGSYLRVYRKQLDGAWRVLQEIRVNRPPAGSAGTGQ